jgi:hypothetical protein
LCVAARYIRRKGRKSAESEGQISNDHKPTSIEGIYRKRVQAEAEMANLDFDILLDDVQVCGRYATNIITMYQNFVSSHKVSVEMW